MGGGTGHFTVLRGLVEKNDPAKITAIPGTWDNGGSSGRLRNELGILPPGDTLRCLIALMEDRGQRQLAQKLLNYRYRENQGSLGGHSLGNLFLAALDDIYSGQDRAINAIRTIFRISANIFPVSLIKDLQLIAKLKSGREIVGETNIDLRSQNPDFDPQDSITRIFFSSRAEPNPQAIKAITEADKIVFSSGDLYTSVLPHLLVPEVKDAILKSKAKVYLILNLMTKKGETDSYKASDFLQSFLYYFDNKPRIDILLANTNHLDKKVADFYKQEGQEPVNVDLGKCKKLLPKLKIIKKPLAKFLVAENLYRHDPEKLAEAILA